ncbi:helix-turn-helix domain-containing protein [Acidithiobacillus sp. VAN18-1]|uniref:Helix-turn-helix domain-containing protein n=1 Tax=Igneacidithiobacillus copahuensis TaxID=2724909 RepID=A0AAE3CJU7_9PROT|nr:excisionase family DNA-binding protein [Igneacidithiobacillus copahuensis]MBU2788074.1 helix-turn-helix domain-containing protein [Igneacidithiobacillus copahuensis]MBU2796117.1 helix-turn-helix domain-containing protein [Acidithiobacillus sp. VAN18-2]
MSKLTITEAAKVVGVSRMTLYKHIKSGRLSVEKDQFGKPNIDVSELIRVFGELRGDVGHDLSDVDSQNMTLQADLKACREVLSTVRQELERALEREAWLQARIEASEQKLLTGPDTRRRWWWPW